MPVELKILVLSIPVDAFCLYKQMRWCSPPDTKLRNMVIVIVSGLILYFTIGTRWYNVWSLGTTDPYGVSSDLQLGMIAVSICPGLIVTTVWTWVDATYTFWKHNRKRK